MLHPMPEKIALTAADQHQFNAAVYPANKPGAPVLVFFSALGTPAKVYRHVGQALAQQGVHFCAPDWRGIDSSSVRAGRGHNFGYRHLVELDMAAVVAVIRRRFPDAPVWLGGHSLGGQLALLYAATHPEQITGAVLIASGSVHMPAYPPAMRLGIATVVLASRVAARVLGYFPGDRIGFGGREAAGVMRDWAHVARTGRYQPQGSTVDYEGALAQLEKPVLALNFAADTWSPAPAARALLDKLPVQSGEHWHWSAKDSANIALDHYSWLKNAPLIAPAVAQYLERKK